METLKNLRGMPYLEYLPEDFDENKKYPVIIYLHGAGERGPGVVNVLKIHGPIKEANAGMKMPFIVLSPQCDYYKTWFEYGERLCALAELCTQTPYMDKSRIYLTGNSMGGFGTWELAMLRPQIFAAIVPICGGGMPWNAPTLKDMPVWAFHCENDPGVNVQETKKMIAALGKCTQVDVRVTYFPSDSHDAWTAAYQNPDVYEWLLSHKR